MCCQGCLVLVAIAGCWSTLIFIDNGHLVFFFTTSAGNPNVHDACMTEPNHKVKNVFMKHYQCPICDQNLFPSLNLQRIAKMMKLTRGGERLVQGYSHQDFVRVSSGNGRQQRQ